MELNRDTSRLNVSDIDFDGITQSLTDYLRSQEVFTDYDFEGSALSSIINLLAYVTHFNAINANIGLNETFLDTAKFRGSVVGHAKLLGYIPRSSISSIAIVDILVNNPNSQSLTINRGHRFKANIDGTSYNFITNKVYNTENGMFSDVELYQGEFRAAEYTYDPRSSQKFLIPDSDVDTRTMRVSVIESANSPNEVTTFVPVKSIIGLDGSSPVYYLEENPDLKFEVKFGDGVLGRKLQKGNIIRIDYIVTQNGAGNGASVFTTPDNINGNTSITIVTKNKASGGTDKESIEQIKFNAPISFSAQNRAVTPKDYEALIREYSPNIDAIKVWGGENNSPPVFGKVFISIKPTDKETLNQFEKNDIQSNVLAPKKVLSITPEFVDPDFLYVTMDVFFKYNQSLTPLTKEDLQEKVRLTINKFNEDNLKTFDKVFRYSNVLRAIDYADNSIVNSSARVYVQKRVRPQLNIITNYVIDFSVPLYITDSTKRVIHRCSFFVYNGVSNCRLVDRYDSITRTRLVDVVSGFGQGSDVVVQRNVGSISGSRLILNQFAPSSISGRFIVIDCIPNSNDVYGTYNTIVEIDCFCQNFNIVGEVDTILSGSEFSGVNYSVPSKYDE